MNDLIPVSELHFKLNDEVQPTVVDVREPEAYARGHIPGAINIPRDQVSSSLDELPLDGLVVTYCNMHLPGDSSSESAAEILREAGLHARALKGGYPEWEEAGYAIQTGEGTPQKR